ncbi:MAG: hypothetical protein IPJ82_07595 [Lewinellaceae bacterium]|nr:hypothetical protein [Lewinellaceae bacterium]
MPNLLLFLLIFFTYNNTYGQKQSILVSAQEQIKHQQYISDSIISKLIKISNDTLSSDSIRVDIILFFAKVACDSCLKHLVENIDERYNYGEGISDLDQSREFACLTSLIGIALNQKDKWRLVSPCFNSLRSERPPPFVSYIRRVLVEITSKKAIKEIIEDELWKNRNKLNYIYEKNLKQILNELGN